MENIITEKLNQKKLIAFMEGKALEVERLTGIEKKKYFHKKDAGCIWEWKNSESYYIWRQIKDFVLSCGILRETRIGLPANVCPFCIKHAHTCSECPYAKKHGVCGKEKSDMLEIYHALGILDSLFSKAFYINLIRSIEYEK